MSTDDATPVDLLVRGTVVNVTTGQLHDGPIAVDDGEIVALAARPAERELEAAYVAPGLIDAHMHVESSMVTLPRYGEAVVPRGVTSVVHDPHEVANVLGEAGVRGFLADAAHTPLKARFTVPSSVPASDLQDGGATLDAATVAALLDATDVIALGEVMNVPGVLAGNSEVHAKIEAARERNLPVDGHAPRLRGDDLHEVARYLDNDHESITLAEAREKVDAGMRVYLREGSSSKNLADLVPIVDDVDSRRLSLCTDDRDVTDLVERGGVDDALRKLIDHGVDPVTAVQLATINTADAYGLPFGRIEPGSPADLVLLSDLESWDVKHVVVDGVVDPTTEASDSPATHLTTDTVAFPALEASDLAIEYDESGPATVRVIDAVGGLQTGRMTASVPVEPLVNTDNDETGVLHANRGADVLPAAVIERHGGNGEIGHGFVHGFGLERGAVGSTVAHDAHNCVVTGVTHEAMARVANHLREVGGGLAVYDPENDDVTALPLPVAGLMSDAPLEDVHKRFEAVETAARDIGFKHNGGLMELSFLTLEVIPEYRLTNNGLVDVTAFDYTDVVAD